MNELIIAAILIGMAFIVGAIVKVWPSIVRFIKAFIRWHSNK